ncbi:transglutaminase family protein [Cellulomonas sp. Marseille-Q8402]
MSGEATLRRGWRSPVATALVALATCTALGALAGLLAPGAWGWHAAVAVGATALVVGGVRSLTASAWLPSGAGLVAAAYGLLAWYATPPGGNPLLVGPGTVEHAGQLLTQAGQLIETSVVPMVVWPPVELVLVGAAVLVFLAADLLAVGCGMPALTGLAFVAMWTPAVVLGFGGSTWALAVTAFLYLILLALAQPPVPRERTTQRAGVVVAGAAGLVVVTLAAGPVVAAVPAWSWVDLPDVGTGAVGPVRLADDLDLRDSLRQQSSQVVLTYTVDSGDDGDGPAVTAGLVGPLRSFTLRDFDGRSWQRDADADVDDWDRDGLLASDPSLVGATPDAARGTLAEVDVRVGALREQRLPVSTFPRTVDIEGPWGYDAARDEVVGRQRTDVGTAYDMLVEVPDLTPALLRSAAGDVPDDVQSYLGVPETDHEDDLRAIAAEITAGATTVYDQALALQSYFRDGTQFRYDTSVDAGESDDAVWDFLQSRRGYCVQFATSMTVLARALDIPARLGVGFLPGELGTDRAYRVTGADAHAWPELYFPGTGWVRFEPTPAVQTGPPPSWSNPFSAAAPTATPSAAAPQSTTAPTAEASTAPGSTGGGLPGDTVDTGSRGPLVAVVVLLALAAATAAVLAWLRRRPGPELAPEVAWKRLRDRLRRAGIVWSDAHTPRQAVATVREQVTARRGRPLGPEGDAALVALAHALERERYAPSPEEYDPAQLQAWVGAVLTDVSTRTRDDAAGPLPAEA